MAETYTVGTIPRTMADVERENALLRQLLTSLWRSLQSKGAYLIQQGQGCESEALMIARELERLGVSVTASVFHGP